MKMIVALAALVAVAIAAPVESDRDVVIVNETPSDNIGLGEYKFGFALSNGATREESAQLVDGGPEGPVQVVKGSFTWINPANNQPITTNYVADKDGFHVEGSHIPPA